MNNVLKLPAAELPDLIRLAEQAEFDSVFRLLPYCTSDLKRRDKKPTSVVKSYKTTYRHKARNDIFVDANFFGHMGKAGKAQIFTRVRE